MSSASTRFTVVVLGAGINGAAIARELVLHRLDVTVIDGGDVASGTTAYSSRLIHGGLRYLEHGDTPLVRESLTERERLLRLAPDFVRPLKFRVPAASRFGGWRDAGLRYFGVARQGRPPSPRGMWLVRAGLAWYDRLARSSSLPRSIVRRRDPVRDALFAPQFRWFCEYYDAQMPYPEQFTTALLADARAAAEETGTRFAVHTYSRATVRGSSLIVVDEIDGREVEYRPAAVVNACGPWGDAVLRKFGLVASPLIGGTKGSHIVVFRDDLRSALGDAAVYAEAPDGRPVFILPFGEGTLIGTTDLPYSGDPAEAVATPAEIDYLLELTASVFPRIRPSPADVTLHYAGVRPLPRSDATTPAAITRRHAVVEQTGLPWPTWTLVGGKLTTCRQSAEETAAIVASRLAIHVAPVSRERPIPSCDRPADGAVDVIAGTNVPRDFVRRVLRTQYVRRLEDVVERRLMLLFAPRLERRTLEDLAGTMAAERVIMPHEQEREVARTVERLAAHFGRRLDA